MTQPKPKARKMWAWVHNSELERAHSRKDMLKVFTRIYGGHLIRVTVTPVAPKARKK